MSKFNCNNTIDFMSEYNRLCESNQECTSCPLFLTLSGNSCVREIIYHSEEAIEIVQKWSDEHPIETYMENFLKLFPNASISPKGQPRSCRAYIYGAPKGCDDLCHEYSSNCYSCWNAIKKEENI